MSDAARTLEEVSKRLMAAVEELVGNGGLAEDWSRAANELYKEQFAKKMNPYGEMWPYRPGDESRKQSRYFGKVLSVGHDGFALRVAPPNANRSCVPFEPRGLGAWRPRFEEILKNRMGIVFRAVR